MNWDLVYENLKKRNWTILLLLSSGSYFIFNNTITLGIIVGGFIIIANFKVLQHTLCSAFSSGGKMNRKKIAIIVKYYLRLLGLGIILYFLIKKNFVDPIGLVIGLSTVVISIVSFGISSALNNSTGEAS